MDLETLNAIDITTKGKEKMKRRKNEDKNMGPMFTMLHVNDTIKGGPRAPPRNKMALYEQLSIPSQSFNECCPLTLIPPPTPFVLI
ncbi:hypothetical protein L2E82_44752 [Cichorium intybus]|uniref:Uncharacterized protein n=1 Tax=Cichorium intybus TaxID=13427 RepID=A0ACB8ZS31_CICIN|nr:hypothetical protein L2E82_44752 [Cichorium intybus]